MVEEIWGREWRVEGWAGRWPWREDLLVLVRGSSVGRRGGVDPTASDHRGAEATANTGNTGKSFSRTVSCQNLWS